MGKNIIDTYINKRKERLTRKLRKHQAFSD